MPAINTDTVNFIIALAREVQEAAEAMIEEELGEDNGTDSFSEDDVISMDELTKLDERAHDIAYQEFVAAVDRLNQDDRNALVALMWVGRGTYGPDEWDAAFADAADADNDHTADYLLRTQLLADYLEEGLSQMSEIWDSEED
ncbi:DUF3775 domain-containing protein [Luteithermobacter gelatinilyticus]|uniref:DUF3775 domain-containing protein n=1 Tax=Luteithermobacter gelatinilyticus TaxID=2582913 RepID=UPI001AEFDC44|nr:DUF3775 domain-containing protein [Luteithermobacter gelatinilyticus]|tara:strand:- start:1996 stop:2424 length:429 start_codon:yes stop_codon:yes gene_type:complete